MVLEGSATKLTRTEVKPRLEYKTKLRDRPDPKPSVSIASLKESLARYERLKSKTSEADRSIIYELTIESDNIAQKRSSIEESSKKKNQQIEQRIESFLKQLKSTNLEDIKMNAEIFGDLIISFAATFNTDVSRVIDAILDDQSSTINMATLRAKLTDLVSTL